MNTTAAPVSAAADRDLLRIAYNIGLGLREIENRKFEWEDVRDDTRLAQAARNFAATYCGDSDWVLKLQNEMAATGILPLRAMPGVLNTLMYEALKRRTAAATPTQRVERTVDALNIANVADGRYRVMLSDADSISVKIDTGIWDDEPKSRRISVLIGADDWMGFGKSLEDGSVRIWKKAADAAPRLRTALTVLAKASDQLAFGIAYYIAGGICMFCFRNLDTAESLEVGYGPVCAKKNGLPWGAVAIPASVRIARAQEAAQPHITAVAAPKAQPKTQSTAVAPTRVAHATTAREIAAKKTTATELAEIERFGISEVDVDEIDDDGRVVSVRRNHPQRETFIRYALGLKGE